MLILVLSLGGYPASLGPMVWLNHRKRLPTGAGQVLQVIYFPLETMIRDGRDFGLLALYVDLWRSLP